MKILTLGAGAVLALTVGAAASAAPLLFSFSGPKSVSFVLDSNPVVDFNRAGFEVSTNVEVNGTSYQSGLMFYPYGLYINIGFAPDNLFLVGDPLFSGSQFAPSFSTKANVSYKGGPLGNVIDDYVLSITNLDAVPEPATWATFIVGFGLVGVATRRRQRVAVSFG